MLARFLQNYEVKEYGVHKLTKISQKYLRKKT